MVAGVAGEGEAVAHEELCVGFGAIIVVELGGGGDGSIREEGEAGGTRRPCYGSERAVVQAVDEGEEDGVGIGGFWRGGGGTEEGAEEGASCEDSGRPEDQIP